MTRNSKRRTKRPPSTVDVTTAALRVESTGPSIFAGASSTSVLGGEVSNLQRDQNRATIVINMGGSQDLDSSRATPAVNKPRTSGLVRDSPDADTPSGSDEGQGSILEVSSVSTDSGIGSRETSFEVDSPPTEEDAVEEESHNTIYERLMCLKKHGFPLWSPQPNTKLPHSYQRQGVSIGDVGIFTLDGGFDFLFNVCLPAGHPDNPDELPEGFLRLDLKPGDVYSSRAHSSDSYMTSPSVQKQGRAMAFKCSGSDGAILTMPEGAHHEDLRNTRRFRDYASINAESWYQYANGHCGREIGNAELHLVTGWDKTTSWGVAVYSRRQSKRGEDNVTQLIFNASNEGQHSYPKYAWDPEGDVEVKAGPNLEDLIDPPEVHALAPLRNQCTFVRSLTPAFSDDEWERLQSKVAVPEEAQASLERLPKSSSVSVLGPTSSLPGRIGFLSGRSRVGTSRSTDSLTPAQTLAAHPATFVVDMLLQKCPKAKVVVVHDSDWCSVIRDSDNDWMSTCQDLQYRIQEAFDIVEEENGTIYLQEKMGSSQRPSTSSHISVKLEEEDFVLLGDRKPGVSLPVGSFEVSSPPRHALPIVASYNAAVNHFDHTRHVAENLNPVDFQSSRETSLALSSEGDDDRMQGMISSAFPNGPPSWASQAGSSTCNEEEIHHALNKRTHQAPINQDDDAATFYTHQDGNTYDSLGDAVGLAQKVKQHAVGSRGVVAATMMRRKNKNQRGKFLCEVCQANLATKHNLANHMRSHYGIEDNYCDGCGKSFGTRSSLMRHTRTCKALPHSGPTPNLPEESITMEQGGNTTDLQQKAQKVSGSDKAGLTSLSAHKPPRPRPTTESTLQRDSKTLEEACQHHHPNLHGTHPTQQAPSSYRTSRERPLPVLPSTSRNYGALHPTMPSPSPCTSTDERSDYMFPALF